jgi:hypothetical protein
VILLSAMMSVKRDCDLGLKFESKRKRSDELRATGSRIKWATFKMFEKK